MKSATLAFAALCLLVHAETGTLRLITLDPGHSHASAVFANPLPGFSDEVHVYAALGPELTDYLDSLTRTNRRPRNPTRWSVNAYAGPDFLERMLREPAGNVGVLSSANDKKMDLILKTVSAGQNVIVDKPWIVDSRDLPKLETALNMADEKGRIAYDCMTQRFDVAYQTQRELMRDPAVFGHALPGTAQDPSVQLENLHAILKYSAAGVPNRRPDWFFDVRQQGEGIADVGTHLIDLELWTLFPDQAIDYRRDVQVLRADRSPVVLTKDQFERVTGEKTWPEFVRDAVKNDRLEYYCNNSAVFAVRGIHAAIRDRWEYEAPPGSKDSYLVSYRGSRATIRVTEGKDESFIPELDVIPNPGEDRTALLDALKAKVPNFSLRDSGDRIRIVIPESERRRGGDFFGQLLNRFVGYVRDPKTLPSWEKPNMIAKYYITTKAVDLARATGQ